MGLTIDAILAAATPEDVFGKLSDDRDKAILKATRLWRKAASLLHPDVNDDPRAADGMRALNALMDRVREGRYGRRSVDVLVRTRRHAYRLRMLMAQGHACNVYRASYSAENEPREAVVKIVRSRTDNDLIANEARTLKRLLSNTATFDALSPYIPEYIEAFGFRDGKGNQARQAIAYRLTEGLFSLATVRERYPNGVHAKDAAWMFRRLLFVLALTHENDVVHGAVVPEHILIHPQQHGLVLLDWKYAVDVGRPLVAVPADARGVYPAEVLDKQPAAKGVDLFMAARCMAYVMGGDPATGEIPSHQPRQIAAFLKGTATPNATGRPQDADALRGEYTELIERLWGPRRFRPFAM